jgi:hypothetical protein
LSNVPYLYLNQKVNSMGSKLCNSRNAIIVIRPRDNDDEVTHVYHFHSIDLGDIHGRIREAHAGVGTEGTSKSPQGTSLTAYRVAMVYVFEYGAESAMTRLGDEFDAHISFGMSVDKCMIVGATTREIYDTIEGK